MSNFDFEEEIEVARKAHSSIPVHLRKSPRILKVPQNKIYHQLKVREREKDKSSDGTLKIDRDFHMMGSLSIKWEFNPCYELLQRHLEFGEVPENLRYDAISDKPVPLYRAYQKAKERGIAVPDKFLEEHQVGLGKNGLGLQYGK